MAPDEVAADIVVENSGFSISHQRIELEVDLLSRSLRGKTEITLSPHSKQLKSIRLNCRQCHLIRVLFNGKPCTELNGKPCAEFERKDPYAQAKYPYSWSVHQYHLLQKRIGDAVDAELVIKPAKNFKIEDIDPSSEEAQSFPASKSTGAVKTQSTGASMTDLAQNTRLNAEQTGQFAPIMLSIEYEIKDVRHGMQFAGWEEGDLRYPHAYSTNSSAPGMACCLFPCVDELTAQCTWEISIKCSRTLGDALKEPSRSVQMNGSSRLSNGVKGPVHGVKSDERPNNFSDEDKALEVAVICSGDMTDDIVDPRDLTKRTVSFRCLTPVSAQHIGFAIGPFEHVDLAKFRESDEDDRLGQNAIPLHGFCLPGRSAEVENTCVPLAKAIDFFTTSYGSYPFSDYKICFVDDVYPEMLHAACLSICNNHILFPEDVIETMDQVTRKLVHALATQWIGIHIVPNTAADTWVVVGISYYMTDIFMRKLCGNNDYRYNQKVWSDRVVEQDIDRPALYDLGTLLTLDPSELEFMALKAPLVLFILDQKLKKSGMTGMSRIISRIFINAKTSDLPDGAISHEFFVKTCEKLGHSNLETFFGQWVYSAGCPKFRVTQKFNKKKLVVEMTIDQVQGESIQDKELSSPTFMREVKEDDRAVYAGTIPPFFTGPMTIRIHEADGTPYEHIIEIKERKTRFEVPYNTKYKRLKRTRRQKERTLANAGVEYAAEGSDEIVLYSLGDVLQTADEVREWKLTEWSADDEEQMSQESYEWIRMDADFEWICKISLSMRPYMWVSQLQQDRDVVAQLETMQFLEGQRGHPLISSICVRTLMDPRYFHGIRTAAANILARCARDEHDWIGRFHLEKAFQAFFCYADSLMTRPNDFSSRTSYYIQCAIPKAISKIRDNNGRSPFKSREFLLEKLKYNDNSSNSYSDAHYLAVLMSGLALAISTNPLPVTRFEDHVTSDPYPDPDPDPDDPAFHLNCLEEIDRFRRLDEWIPSYHNILSRTALDCTSLLTKHSLVPLNSASFLQYTADGHFSLLRLTAFTNLLSLGTFKQAPILRWFLFVLSTDPSPYIRSNLMLLLGRIIGSIAIGESLLTKPLHDDLANGGLIIEQEASTEIRAADLARKQTIVGAKAALRDELGTIDVLKTELWAAIESPTISLQMQGELLTICSWLYTPETSAVVVMQYPRYWTCRKTAKGKLTFTRSGSVRTTPHIETWVRPSVATSQYSTANGAAVAANASSSVPHPPLKRQGSSSGAARPVFKPPKAQRLSTPKPVLQSGTGASVSGGGAGGQQPQTPGTPATPGLDAEGKPRIKLIIKFGGGSGGGGGAGSPTA